MTDIEKKLLISDLCARLPYGVKVEVTNTQGYHHENVANKGEKTIDTLKGFDSSHNSFTVYHNNPLDWDWTCSEIDIEDIKPYLIPISKMTEEQRLEIEIITRESIGFDTYSLYDFTGYSEISLSSTMEIIQWCYENHIDINGLIPMGLAIEAPEGMYD